MYGPRRVASGRCPDSGCRRAYGVLNNFYQRLLPAADRDERLRDLYRPEKRRLLHLLDGQQRRADLRHQRRRRRATNPFSGLTDTTSFGRGYRTLLQYPFEGRHGEGVWPTFRT